MDTFAKAFQDSQNPDNAVRNEATKFIEQAKTKPGFLRGMMELSVLADVDTNINLAASIQLKNMCELHWKFWTLEEARIYIDEEDE